MSIRERKKLKSKLKMTESKAKKGPAKKNQAYKFDKKNPGAYIPSKEWKLLNVEQMAAAREARKEAGIPTRKVSFLFSGFSKGTQGGNSKGTPMSDSDDDSSEDTEQPSKLKILQQVPPSLLRAPTYKDVATSQRELYYDSKRAARKTVAKETVQDPTEGITRKLGALHT